MSNSIFDQMRDAARRAAQNLDERFDLKNKAEQGINAAGEAARRAGFGADGFAAHRRALSRGVVGAQGRKGVHRRILWVRERRTETRSMGPVRLGGASGGSRQARRSRSEPAGAGW